MYALRQNKTSVQYMPIVLDNSLECEWQESYLRGVIMNSKKRQGKEQLLLNEAYDLILNPKTLEKERIALLSFKNAIESGKNFESALMHLVKTVKELAVSQLDHRSKLSPAVNKFYIVIATTG